MNKTVSIPLIVMLLTTSLYIVMNLDRGFDKAILLQVALNSFSVTAVACLIFIYARAEKDSDTKLGRMVREHLSTLAPLMGIGFITGIVDLATLLATK